MGRHSPADQAQLPRHRALETIPASETTRFPATTISCETIRSLEPIRLTRSEERAAARTKANQVSRRRKRLVPASGVLLAMILAGNAYHFMVHPASASAERPVRTSSDLSALVSTAQSSTAASIEVSRDKRQSDTANADALPLPARPGLPALDPSKTVAGTWVRPSSGPLSSCFCMRWGVFHEGIDLAAPLGSPIVATGDGVVLEAGPAEGFGHWIVVQQSNGDVTIYGHMFTVLVQKGQHVTAGEHIADVGDDGEATGPHLHFGVRKGGIDGPYIDPIPWLRARGVNVGSYDPNA